MARKGTDTVPHWSQHYEFRHWLCDEGWQPLVTFEDGGHFFEMFGKNGRTLLMQVHPGGHGFEIWTPVTTSNEIEATKEAIRNAAQ